MGPSDTSLAVCRGLHQAYLLAWPGPGLRQRLAPAAAAQQPESHLDLVRGTALVSTALVSTASVSLSKYRFDLVRGTALVSTQ